MTQKTQTSLGKTMPKMLQETHLIPQYWPILFFLGVREGGWGMGCEFNNSEEMKQWETYEG